MFVFVLAEVSMCKNPLLSAYLAASCTKTYTKCSQKSFELTGEKTCLGGDIPMTFGKVEFVPNQCNDDARIAFLLHLFDPPFGLSQRLLFANHQGWISRVSPRRAHVRNKFWKRHSHILKQDLVGNVINEHHNGSTTVVQGQNAAVCLYITRTTKVCVCVCVCVCLCVRACVVVVDNFKCGGMERARVLM